MKKLIQIDVDAVRYYTMKVFLLAILVLATASADRCKPKYHFWRPYNGTIPNDAFLAAIDSNGIKSYVAKVIPLDEYLWTVPVQIGENATDHVDFAWCCGPDKVTTKIDKFIEILCTKTAENLFWQKIDESVEEASRYCCLVESGIALHHRQIVSSYIGRAEREGEEFIGRAYSKTSGFYSMNGTTPIEFKTNFEALVYDCKNDKLS